MPLTVMTVLLVVGIILMVVHIVRSPFPLWPAVLVLFVMELIHTFPMGKL